MEQIQFNLFLNNLRDEEKRLFRKYEKTYLRIITTTKAIAFNENCIREQLCPKTRFIYVIEVFTDSNSELLA